MNYIIYGKITNITAIAIGNSIRDLNRLRKTYGNGKWKKLK